MAAYLTHRKPKVSPTCENNTVNHVEKVTVSHIPPEEQEKSLEWADIAKLLEKKLTSEAFTTTLRYSIRT